MSDIKQTTIDGADLCIIDELADLQELEEPAALSPIGFDKPEHTAPAAAGWICRTPWWDGALVLATVQGVECWLVLRTAYEAVANHEPAIVLLLRDAAGEPWSTIVPPAREILTETHTNYWEARK